MPCGGEFKFPPYEAPPEKLEKIAVRKFDRLVDLSIQDLQDSRENHWGGYSPP